MPVPTILRTALLALLVVAASAIGADKAGRDAGAAKGKGGPRATQVGLASYYGARFEGRKTASGEVFDKEELVAAHPSYPLGTRARVTNLRNGRSQEVRIIDRGPTARHQYRGVIIDVSEQVARDLAFRKKGRTRVKVQVLQWGEKPEGKGAAVANAGS